MNVRHLTAARPGRLFAMGLGLAIIGCAAPVAAWAQQPAPATAVSVENFDDPLENTNRAVFGFNQQVDRIVLVPLATTYKTVVPGPVRDSVHDFLRNLDEPIIFANDVLQARPDLASTTLARFVVNSTIGIGGLWDPATKMHLPYHSNDLGVTFAVWGIGSGPYLILPVLGPSNVRDAVGMVGDGYADPGNIIASDNHVVWAAFARAGTEGIDARSRNIKTLADIERTSLDYYATIRSLYRQRRAAQIRHEYTDIPNVSPVQGGDDTAAPPISYQVAPGSSPVEAPKK
jgi:phospholipid-binding lipoprotein MlaA